MHVEAELRRFFNWCEPKSWDDKDEIDDRTGFRGSWSRKDKAAEGLEVCTADEVESDVEVLVDVHVWIREDKRNEISENEQQKVFLDDEAFGQLVRSDKAMRSRRGIDKSCYRGRYLPSRLMSIRRGWCPFSRLMLSLRSWCLPSRLVLSRRGRSTCGGSRSVDWN